MFPASVLLAVWSVSRCCCPCRKREPFAEANRPKGGFYGRLFRTDMLVHDACANIVRIDRRLSDRGHGGAERIHGMTARAEIGKKRADS